MGLVLPCAPHSNSPLSHPVHPLKEHAQIHIHQQHCPCMVGPGGLHFAPGYGENSTRLAQRLGAAAAEKDASLALLVGDLAYALG